MPEIRNMRVRVRDISETNSLLCIEKMDFMDEGYLPFILEQLEKQNVVESSTYTDQVYLDPDDNIKYLCASLVSLECDSKDLAGIIAAATMSYFNGSTNASNEKTDEVKPAPEQVAESKQQNHAANKTIDNLLNTKPRTKGKLQRDLESFFTEVDTDAPSYIQGIKVCPNIVTGMLKDMYMDAYQQLIWIALKLKHKSNSDSRLIHDLKQGRDDLREMLDVIDDEIKFMSEYAKDCRKCPVREHCNASLL